MSQLEMSFENITERHLFDGSDIVPEHDNIRLTGQLRNIFQLMRDSQWRTLREIEEVTGYGQASISAQLRNLKKERWGFNGLERQARGERSRGLWEYKLIVNSAKQFTLELK